MATSGTFKKSVFIAGVSYPVGAATIDDSLVSQLDRETFVPTVDPTPGLGDSAEIARETSIATAAAAAAVAGLATYHVGLYGAIGDGQKLQDGAITSGTTAFTSAGSLFTAAAVGKSISVRGAGAAGAPLTTAIAAVVSPTAVTLAAAAGTTVSAAHFAWGTDDSVAFQAASDAAFAAGGGTVRFTGKTYYVGASTAPHDGVSFVGVSAATSMPTATDFQNEFWDLNAARKYQWANRGGTVFVGPANIAAISFARHTGYLTGCTFENLAHDGLLTLLKIGQVDDYGAANCRFINCKGVNSTGYDFDICNSQLCYFSHCYAIYSAGFLHFSSRFSGAGYFRSAGNSTFVECFGALGPLGDANHGIWLDADGGVIDAVTFIRPQVNRLQVTANSNTAACIRVQGRNGTDSIVQFVRLVDPDLEGFASYLLDVSYATGCFIEFFKIARQPSNTGDLRITSGLDYPLGGNVIMSGFPAVVNHDGHGGNMFFGLSQSWSNQKMQGFYIIGNGGYARMVGVPTHAEMTFDYGVLDMSTGSGLAVKPRVNSINSTGTIDKFYAGLIRLTGTGTYQLNLDAPASTTGLIFTFKKEGASGTVTLAASSIEGGTTKTMSTQWDTLRLQSNGTTYLVV